MWARSVVLHGIVVLVYLVQEDDVSAEVADGVMLREHTVVLTVIVVQEVVMVAPVQIHASVVGTLYPEQV